MAEMINSFIQDGEAVVVFGPSNSVSHPVR